MQGETAQERGTAVRSFWAWGVQMRKPMWWCRRLLVLFFSSLFVTFVPHATSSSWETTALRFGGTRAHIHTYTRTHKHTYTRTHKHTHTVASAGLLSAYQYCMVKWEMLTFFQLPWQSTEILKNQESFCFTMKVRKGKHSINNSSFSEVIRHLFEKIDVG